MKKGKAAGFTLFNLLRIKRQKKAKLELNE